MRLKSENTQLKKINMSLFMDHDHDHDVVEEVVNKVCKMNMSVSLSFDTKRTDQTLREKLSG